MPAATASFGDHRAAAARKQNISRMQLSDASGLSLRFLSPLTGKAASASLTQIMPISFGLKCPITDLVNAFVAMEEKLGS